MNWWIIRHNMCGIAGKVYFDRSRVEKGDLALMASKITHRGPDDEGIYVSEDKKVGLASRRLAIIDLSKNGHQPMSYMSRYVITTNGEIYNFQKEKQDLEKLGYKFTSDCDTEVILALYDKYKEKCLDHLRGMFAFAIYDRLKKTLFLARDRIGKKPLKYYLANRTFIFSSEVKAILTQPEVSVSPDLTAIAKYLTYGYIPSPLTGFTGIKKLKPGHFMILDLKKGRINIKKYWEPMFSEKLTLSEKEWCERILTTLTEATKLRMISDVPLGAFLSGGVDSSGVVATMARLSNKPVKTFTVKFKDKRWDESGYAKNIARMYATDHTELPVSPLNIDLLPEISASFEEPFADAGLMVSYMVSKLAREHVSVVLNGDGGDENFAGYPNRYLRLKRDVDYNNYINLLRPAAVFGLRAINTKFNESRINKLKLFFEKSKLPLYQRFVSYNHIFSDVEIVNIVAGELKQTLTQLDNPYEEVEECFSLFKGKDLKDAGLKFDLLFWLPDDLLAKSDMTNMAHSLEGRSPFLDTEMLNLAGKIPFNLKVKGGESKYILKKALEKIVPRENLYREKRGFGLPLHKWFSGEMNRYARLLLLSKNTKIRNIINTKMVKEMLDTHSEKQDLGPKLWALLTLELWYGAYFQK